MSRRLLRPFLNDPFFMPSFFTRPSVISIQRVPRQQLKKQELHKNDPNSIFENFFNENGIKSEAEKDFFKKHYPETVEEPYDPYKALGVEKNASLEHVKEAYRKLAIQNHPKNNQSPEAQQKFADLAKAYQSIVESQKTSKYNEFGLGSFFEDFDREVNRLFNIEPQRVENVEKEPKNSAKTEANNAEKESSKDLSEHGELYSESSHMESYNGQQTKYVVEKKYKTKEGKILNVKREELLKDNGKMEITETIDDGKEVKKKQYLQDVTQNSQKVGQLL